jgi:hypothetical protein
MSRVGRAGREGAAFLLHPKEIRAGGGAYGESDVPGGGVKGQESEGRDGREGVKGPLRFLNECQCDAECNTANTTAAIAFISNIPSPPNLFCQVRFARRRLLGTRASEWEAAAGLGGEGGGNVRARGLGG